MNLSLRPPSNKHTGVVWFYRGFHEEGLPSQQHWNCILPSSKVVEWLHIKPWQAAKHRENAHWAVC